MSGLQNSPDTMTKLAGNPPTYEKATGSSDTGAPSSPLSLPLTLNAYNPLSIEGMTAFWYCGQSTEDRLYTVKIQNLRSGGKAPVGERPGIFLHSGPSTSSPIIAAAADDETAPYKHTNPDSDIILVNTPNSNIDNNDVATDVMRERKTDGGKVAFTFQVEVGGGVEGRKDVFSWIRVAKKEAGLEHGGYRLVRHPPKPETNSFCPTFPFDEHWPAHDMSNEDDLLAILSNGKSLQLSTSAHMYTIQFTNEDVLRKIGYNPARAILVTAARLRHLKYLHRLG
ncbi:hypothetical protein F4679DRAFT_588457 [Xylaria curta]|nr:hypothetical protein F4679DRAFT_588457 [Xylaria curta]